MTSQPERARAATACAQPGGKPAGAADRIGGEGITPGRSGNREPDAVADRGARGAEWPCASEKVERPSTHFAGPHDVVADGELSDQQKRRALDTLEQDARQLSDATAEGMSGGERGNLDEVLNAKAKLSDPQEALALPARARGDRLLGAIRQYPLPTLAAAIFAGIGVWLWVRH